MARDVFPRGHHVRLMHAIHRTIGLAAVVAREADGHNGEEPCAVAAAEVEQLRVEVVLAIRSRDAERDGVLHAHERHADVREKIVAQEPSLFENQNVACGAASACTRETMRKTTTSPSLAWCGTAEQNGVSLTSRSRSQRMALWQQLPFVGNESATGARARAREPR